MACFDCEMSPGYPIPYLNHKVAKKQNAVGHEKPTADSEFNVRFICASARTVLKVFRVALMKMPNAKKLALCPYFFVDHLTNSQMSNARQETVLRKFVQNFFKWKKQKISYGDARKLVFWNKPMRSIYVSTYHECQKRQSVRQNVAPTENTAKVALTHYSPFQFKFRDELFLMWGVGHEMRRHENCPKFLSWLGSLEYEVVVKWIGILDRAYDVVLKKMNR